MIMEFVPTRETLPKIISANRQYRNMNMSLLVYGNTKRLSDIINFTVPVMQHPVEDVPNPYTSVDI